VSDPGDTPIWSGGTTVGGIGTSGISNGVPERLWRYDDVPAIEEQESPASGTTGGLVSLGFLKAALGRRKRFWYATAAIGFLLGCGYYVAAPPGYQATTSVLLTPGPYDNINTAATNDVAMAETRTVAGLAVRELGLRQSAASFASTYVVAALTERVVVITAKARTSEQAVLNATAVASAFLKFRTEEMQTQQNLVLAALNRQVDQEQQHLNSIEAQITQVSAQTASPAQQAQLKTLRAQQTKSNATLFDLRQAALGNQTVNGSATTAAAKASVMLDAAIPLAHSRVKPLLLDAVFGLIAGLAVGMAIVIIQAIVSDRLRQRDDIARALGMPVKVSVGTIRLKSRLPRPGGAAARDAAVQRVVTHLARCVPRSPGGVASSLAVVPVDDLRVPAWCLVALAVSCAKEGKHVVVADLCRGAPVAKLLGSAEPGVREVSTRGVSLVSAVPDRGDIVPLGPLDRGAASAQRSSFTEAVATACVSADVLLTLATLDPALGGEHLATWATDAVAMVTAGQSSWTKIQGVGELIRLSGTRLVSAVLVGTDRSDETLGTIRLPETV
jgi:capsular polysaccharide biosynthesis protein